MLRFPVSPSKAEDLRRRMVALGLVETDFSETFFCPSHGRQRKRRAQIGVQLYHTTTQSEIRCQKSTSQALNRFLARRMLVRLLEKRRDGVLPETKSSKSVAPPNESPQQHMQRMFARSFERDIAQPYPLPSQKLLGAGNLPAKLIGILGEREVPRTRK